MTVRSSVYSGENPAGTAGLGGPKRLAISRNAPSQQRSGRSGVPTGGGDWWSVAACQRADPDLFFPVSAAGKSLEQVAEAKAICAGCLVRAECLVFALQTNQLHGVWGGMTEAERHQARMAGDPGEREECAPAAAADGDAFAGGRAPQAGGRGDHHPGPPRSPSRAADERYSPTRAAVSHQPTGPALALRGTAWAGELVEMQTMAARAACRQMTPAALKALGEIVGRAAGLPSRPGWERKAAAHAEIFLGLADMVPDPAAAYALSNAATLIRDLLVTVGPAANGMTVSSRQRLLAHLRAGDAGRAELEMESHMKDLYLMWRMAGGPAPSRAESGGSLS
jgi:WhiB family transcriptional regulator, redox-sensing transcriptional regulator